MPMQGKSARRRPRNSPDRLLIVFGAALGLICALAYAAWHAVNRAGASGAWGDFRATLLFPGVLVVAGVIAMVWLGWKANIDD
jgi:hypothetical protein